MKVVSILIGSFVFISLEVFAQEPTGQMIDTVIDLLQTKKSEFRKGQKIIGVAVFRDKDFDYPVKVQQITLLYENKIILTGSTNLDGTFELYGDLKKGKHKLKIKSKLYQGEQEIFIPSKDNQYKIICIKRDH